jgi:leader peptidase (prepilin peptidase) / N-methyltransferase
MMQMITVHLFMAFGGLLAGGLINALADDLPRRLRPRLPHCRECGVRYPVWAWLGVGRLLFSQGACPACGGGTGWRAPAVEIGLAVWLGLLPLWVSGWERLAVVGGYTAVLLLIMVIDLETKLILHVVTFPTTVIALILSNFMPGYNSFPLALLGAVTGFLIFYILYWVGQLTFGPGALGFGDVTLSMTLGAMLGFHLIIFTLVLGMLIGGITSLILVLSGRRGLYLPYGQYLALAGMIMLVWGQTFFAWYTR